MYEVGSSCCGNAVQVYCLVLDVIVGIGSEVPCRLLWNMGSGAVNALVYVRPLLRDALRS